MIDSIDNLLTNWYLLFGVVNGDLKAFGEPMSVEGELLDSQSGFLDFKVWAHHFRIVFPIRVDWAAGKLLPAHDCQLIVRRPRHQSKKRPRAVWTIVWTSKKRGFLDPRNWLSPPRRAGLFFGATRLRHFRPRL